MSLAQQQSQSHKTTSSDRVITVGMTMPHGMAHEASLAPPDGVRYDFLKVTNKRRGPIRSPIPPFMWSYDDAHVDLVESLLCPTNTDRPWICSVDCYQAAMAFSFLGLPLPKFVRQRYLNRYFLKDNFKKLIFWSEAAAETLQSYGGVENEELLRKSAVVYPAIREVPENLLATPDDGLRIMFSGDFFRKGGTHVVDAFLELHREFPEATLRLCCDEKIDFKTPNQRLKQDYLEKIERHHAITLGRVPRDTLLREILPKTDIYLLPTYAEAFGFSILEAMAYGIPVVATNVFAIPEIIDHETSGFLIDTRGFDLDKMFRGYTVNRIPEDFNDHMTTQLLGALQALAASPQTRRAVGEAARMQTRVKFSFERRNERMKAIYKYALD